MLAKPKIAPIAVDCAVPSISAASITGRYANVTEIGGMCTYPRNVNDINISNAASTTKTYRLKVVAFAFLGRFIRFQIPSHIFSAAFLFVKKEQCRLSRRRIRKCCPFLNCSDFNRLGVFGKAHKQPLSRRFCLLQNRLPSA